MSVPASNYSSDDNKGATLGHFRFINKSSTVWAYIYRPMESPSYYIGTNNTFMELNFYGANGTLYDTGLGDINLLLNKSTKT